MPYGDNCAVQTTIPGFKGAGIPNAPARRRVVRPPRNFSDVLGLYDLCRKYAQHENDLINQRAIWSITIQGFAFTASGLALTAFTGHAISAGKCELLIGCFAAACLLVALFAGLSIIAAQRAIAALKASWSEQAAKEPILNTLPKVIGVNRSSIFLGHSAPLAVQSVFLVFWGGLILFLAFSHAQTPCLPTFSVSVWPFHAWPG
jgi:hypothetical protein